MEWVLAVDNVLATFFLAETGNALGVHVRIVDVHRSLDTGAQLGDLHPYPFPWSQESPTLRYLSLNLRCNALGDPGAQFLSGLKVQSFPPLAVIV